MANPQSKLQQRRQIPNCYYEGYLEKSSAKEKVSQRLWASLCGNTLFFYNTIKDVEYVDRIDLDGFISLLDDNSRDRNLGAARFQLRTKEGEFKITVPTLENRELWKGFIHAVAEHSVPSTLNLLPGQVHMLQEVVEKEQERQNTAAVQDNLYLSLVADMPPCFHEVSRKEAMGLLEKYADCGNMLLRPSKDGFMAVTTRQDLNGSVFHHYRVIRRPEGGFLINLETPIPCDNLYEVIKCLEEKTSGILQPFILNNIYNDNITLVQQNEENGEKNLKFITGSPSLKAPPPGSNTMQESLHPACVPAGPSKTANSKKKKPNHTGSGTRAPMLLPKFVKKFVSSVQDSLPSNSSSEEQSSGTDQLLVTVPSVSAKTGMQNKQAISKPPFAMGSSIGDLPLANAKESKPNHTGSGTRAPIPLPRFGKKFVSPVQDSLPSNSSSEEQSSGTDQLLVTVPSVSAKTGLQNKQAISKPPFAMGSSIGDLPLAFSEELKKKVEERQENKK